jgi:hypothetical protein
VPVESIIRVRVNGRGGDNIAPPVVVPPIANADSVWTPLSVMSVVNPIDFGAVGNGVANDLPALQAAVDALPSGGGIVFLPSGKTFAKPSDLHVQKDHVKFWAVNRGATFAGTSGGASSVQAIQFQKGIDSGTGEPFTTEGCGVFGVRVVGAATNRVGTDGLAIIYASNVELVGNEISGAGGVGVMLNRVAGVHVEGNYIHHTWADHIHHTNACSYSYCWGNWLVNGSPTNGDDGIACVSYGGVSAPRGHDMEWWRNTIVNKPGGRGYAVVGGDRIHIHHNWARQVGAAGILVAAESSFDTPGSRDIRIIENYIDDCGQIVHPGILLSGLNGAGAPIENVTLTNNVSVNCVHGAINGEGFVTGTIDTGLNSSPLPSPVPVETGAVLADTTVLRTRDTSHVAPGERAGLYRIHVRKNPVGSGFQQRFEYVLSGADATMSSFLSTRVVAGDYVSESRSSGGVTRAVVLARAPLTLTGGVSAVTFDDLRSGDNSGALTWLWNRVNGTSY